MKYVLIILSVLFFTSCKTYTDFEYRGIERVEFHDTLKLEPIHIHFTNNEKPECLWLQIHPIPYTQVLYIENWCQ